MQVSVQTRLTKLLILHLTQIVRIQVDQLLTSTLAKDMAIKSRGWG